VRFFWATLYMAAGQAGERLAVPGGVMGSCLEARQWEVVWRVGRVHCKNYRRLRGKQWWFYVGASPPPPQKM